VREKIQACINKAGKLEVSPQLALQVLSLIDLTSLGDHDTEASVKELMDKASLPVGHVAAVCVYPQFLSCATTSLSGTSVKIATVANFPLGMSSIDEVIYTIRQAIQMGAQEIDVVFPYGRYLAGDKLGALEFIRLCKGACGNDVLLKVILETSAYPHLQIVADVAQDAILAGADFLKTSTGKMAIGATLEAAAVMLQVIKEMRHSVKRNLGFKAAGGIRTLEQAASYIALANHILGPDWVKPSTFRLGASQLMDVVTSTL
jgi:deoxyribose-phosphate aldolase